MKSLSLSYFAFAACLALWSSLSTAGEFTLLIYESMDDLALRSKQTEQSADYWAEYRAFGRELAVAKIIRGGAPLDVPATARAIGNNGASIDVSPYKGLGLGGYFQIEVASFETALAWARKAPATRRGGVVEVRPVIAAPGM